MVARRVDGDDERDRIAEALAGLPAENERVAADNLEIDHRYQRKHVRKAWVDHIAENFDPDLFQPPRVNRRRWDNNRLMVMDGQHRLLAIRQMGWGDQLILCTVYDNLSYETECKVFDTQGATRPLGPQEQFRSRLERHEADEEVVDGLVRKAGYRLNLDSGHTDDGAIAAVSTLLRIVRRHRSGMLTDVLEVCVGAFGPGYGPKAAMLDGVTRFLARYRTHERYDRRRLIEALRQTTMLGLIAAGDDVKRAMSVSPGDGVAYKILALYNHRLSAERKLPDWSFSGRDRKR